MTGVLINPYVFGVGGGASKSAGAVTLSGTLGSPNLATRTITGTARAGWRFEADKETYRRQGTWTNFNENWLDGAGAVADYEIRATKESGDDPDSGGLDIWLSLAGNRAWEIANSANGTMKECVLKIEIRDANTLTIRDTGYYKIYAEDSGGGGTTITATSLTIETGITL